MSWSFITDSEFVDVKTTNIVDKITIGREPSNSLPIKKNEISRAHAEVYLDNGAVVVIDLGSSNGTFVNGKRLEPNAPTKLANGDSVSFESVKFTLRSLDSSQTSVLRSLDMPAENKTSVQKAIDIKTKLTLIKGDTLNGVKTFNLDGLESIVSGRNPTCQIALNDPTVSGQHAKFTNTNMGWEVANLSQTNGLFVNGQNIVKILLNDKDNIELGGCILKFSSEIGSNAGKAGSTNQIPDWLRNQE